MNVVIFEDDRDYGAFLEQAVKECGYEPVVYNNSSAVFEHIKRGASPVLYLLDIVEGNEAVGLDLAQAIMLADRGDLIIFITAYPEHIATNTYMKVKGFNSIIKGETTQEEIFLSLYMAEQHLQSDYLTIGKSKFVTIPIHDILYITIAGKQVKKLEIITRRGVALIGGTLGEAMKQLDDRFIQVSRSHIINKRYITGMDSKRRIVTIGDYEIPYATGRRNMIDAAVRNLSV